MNEEIKLNCGDPSDLGHHILNELKYQVKVLNDCVSRMKREKDRNYMFDEVLRRAKTMSPGNTMRFRAGLLKWENQRVGIDEEKFFKMYSQTDSGKYAKRESEIRQDTTFGKFEKVKRA